MFFIFSLDDWCCHQCDGQSMLTTPSIRLRLQQMMISRSLPQRLSKHAYQWRIQEGTRGPCPPNTDPSHKWYSEYRRQCRYSIPTHLYSTIQSSQFYLRALVKSKCGNLLRQNTYFFTAIHRVVGLTHRRKSRGGHGGRVPPENWTAGTVLHYAPQI